MDSCCFQIDIDYEKGNPFINGSLDSLANGAELDACSRLFSSRIPSLNSLSIVFPDSNKYVVEDTPCALRSTSSDDNNSSTSYSLKNSVYGSYESSFGDNEMVPRQRSARSLKHSASEKIRNGRFNACIDFFHSTLSDHDISVHNNKLSILIKGVAFLSQLQEEVAHLRKKEKKLSRSRITPVYRSLPCLCEEYSLYQAFPIPTALADLSGCILSVNPAFLNLFQITAPPSSLFSIAPPLYLPLFYNAFGLLLANNPKDSCINTLRLFQKDGFSMLYIVSLQLYKPNEHASCFAFRMYPVIHQNELYHYSLRSPSSKSSSQFSSVESFQLSSGQVFPFGYCALNSVEGIRFYRN